MEWKKLYNKTFNGSFFWKSPPMMKALWAVLITQADDEGVADLDRSITLLRGSHSHPKTGPALSYVQSMTLAGMVQTFQKNGINYVKFLNWSSYQQFEKSTDRQRERKRDGGAPPRATPGGAGGAPLKTGEEWRGQSSIRDYWNRVRGAGGTNGNGVAVAGNGGTGGNGGNGQVGNQEGQGGANPAAQEAISDNNGNSR